jgi:hypothetical protein
MRHFCVIHNWELRNMRLLPSSMPIRHALITEKQTCTPCIAVRLRNYITRHKDAQDRRSAATRILTLTLHATEW